MPGVESIFMQHYSHWNTQQTVSATDKLVNLIRLMPHFSRRAAKWADMENPEADLIVCDPFSHSLKPTPVALVSKNYELIQHTELVEELMEGLRTICEAPEILPASMIMSEHGERLYLSVLIEESQILPADGHPISLSVHCFNSVDRSLALQIRLGWYRWICGNGMFWGKEQMKLRRLHTASMRPMDLPGLIARQLVQGEAEAERIRQWQNASVKMDTIAEWVDTTLAKQWSVDSAARVFHISKTGFDGSVKIKPTVKLKPHERPVSSDFKVPGAIAPTTNAYQFSQALSWVAKTATNVQDSLDRLYAIVPLVEKLIAEKNED